MRRRSSDGRFGERTLEGFDDGGGRERIVIWIERKPGGVWAVGRAIDPQHRSGEEARDQDYLFDGYDDALEAANGTLRDDLRVSEQDRRPQEIAAFERAEILRPLERWFFGRR